MELRQLVYFEAVARCGGFTRAADDLHVAQPAVSVQIRQLERELGVALLARTTRRVALTEAGEQFLARARRVLAELDAARDDAADLAAVLRGRVVVGAATVTGPSEGYDLAGALAAFARRHPGVSMSLRSGLLPDLLAGVDDGAVDLVLGPLAQDLPPAYATHPLFHDRLVLAAPPGRIGGAGPVTLSGLAGEPFVCLPAGSGLRMLLDGLVPGADVPFEASTPGGVRELVAAGLGIALMAASATSAPGAAVDVREIRPAPSAPPFGLVHREPLGPAARALRDHLLGRQSNRSGSVRTTSSHSGWNENHPA